MKPSPNKVKKVKAFAVLYKDGAIVGMTTGNPRIEIHEIAAVGEKNKLTCHAPNLKFKIAPVTITIHSPKKRK